MSNWNCFHSAACVCVCVWYTLLPFLIGRCTICLLPLVRRLVVVVYWTITETCCATNCIYVIHSHLLTKYHSYITTTIQIIRKLAMQRMAFLKLCLITLWLVYDTPIFVIFHIVEMRLIVWHPFYWYCSQSHWLFCCCSCWSCSELRDKPTKKAQFPFESDWIDLRLALKVSNFGHNITSG